MDTVYDPTAYNTLPSLRKAHNLMTEDAIAKLRGPIRQLFIDRGMQNHYGICLLHNHFQIGDDQRLVEHGHVSLPWNLDDDNIIVSNLGGVIVPRSIRLFNGKPAPFEFVFVREEPKLDIGFVADALHAIQDLGLHDVLGVRYFDTYDPKYSVEITQGNANVMVPGGEGLSGLLEAFWVFSLDEDQRCHCREQCFPQEGDDHQENHSCG